MERWRYKKIDSLAVTSAVPPLETVTLAFLIRWELVPVVTTWEEKRLKKNQPNKQRVLEILLLTPVQETLLRENKSTLGPGKTDY